MEIKLDSKSITAFKELTYQKKVIQEICESVVPDTDEDIGKIAAVQSSVILKSKDITSLGVLITGEVTASLIYITESQEKLSFMKIKKAFSIEYDVPEIGQNYIAQINLMVVSNEAKLINPRKVSVCFEIAGELNCYVSEEVPVEYGLPADCTEGIHVKYESSELSLISAVCEKTFSINEQLAFVNGKPVPSRIVSADARLYIIDTQFVGTKAIVKGNAEIQLTYFSDEVGYPVKTEMNTSFSQVIDISDENADSCNIIPAVTGLYYGIADSISGDKILDLELHAVLQLSCRSNRNILYVSDSYSNVMSSDCVGEKFIYNTVSDTKKIKLSADERLNVEEDCADVLSLFVSIGPLSYDEEKLKANIYVDILYKKDSGEISSVRRTIMLQNDLPGLGCRISSAKLADVYLRPDGQLIDAHLALELFYLTCSTVELTRVQSIKLEEEKIIELEKYPTVTLVRCTEETLWDLAKKYHSSVEKIRASNEDCEDIYGKMILVPKTI